MMKKMGEAADDEEDGRVQRVCGGNGLQIDAWLEAGGRAGVNDEAIAADAQGGNGRIPAENHEAMVECNDLGAVIGQHMTNDGGAQGGCIEMSEIAIIAGSVDQSPCSDLQMPLMANVEVNQNMHRMHGLDRLDSNDDESIAIGNADMCRLLP